MTDRLKSSLLECSKHRLVFAAIRDAARVVVPVLIAALFCAQPRHRAVKAEDTIRDAQKKTVKIYGAGGIRGLEAYQSGFLISADGYVLTVFSHVLDSDVITVTLDDGRRSEGKLVGADPRLEIAVLKIDAADLPHFDLGRAVAGKEGTRVLAFSNLFGVATGDEPVSVLHGTIAAVTPLSARRGLMNQPIKERFMCSMP